MSDSAAIQIVTAVLGLIGTMFTGVMAYLMARLDRSAKVAVDTIGNARAELGEVAAVGVKTAKTVDTVHMLVNSAMTAQLKITMVALERIADLTKHPKDLEAAKVAREAFETHEKQQAKVDDKAKD